MIVATSLTGEDRRRLDKLVEEQGTTIAAFLRSLVREAVREEATGG